jgi:RND family efflux transporter MFP subunit
MAKKFVVAVAVVAVVAAGVYAARSSGFSALRWFGRSDAAVAQQSPQAPRPVGVEVAVATKKDMPVLLDGIGNVTTIANVAVRSRLDNEIVEVHFADGAKVNKGDLLLTLDQRALQAQVKQVEGNIERDQAQIDGALRDVRRYTDLVAKAATPVLNLENARTQVATFTGALKADQAALENLKVQLSYCVIRAPISGRISQAAVKVGNFVRAADILPIAMINQMAPVYVTFTIPQANLPDVRRALAAGTANVEVIIPGETRRARGVVTMVENVVDVTTGMATVRATMPNEDELLWPGTLVTARMTLRVENSVALPSVAVQVSQSGPFVFVIKDQKAVVQPVKVERTVGDQTVISEGLAGGETVVTDGQIRLTNGSPVAPHERKSEPKSGA